MLDRRFLEKMDEAGYVHSLFMEETCNWLDYGCPFCQSSDRERLYALYIKQQFSTLQWSHGYRFIDFAPAQQLSKLLRSFPLLEYRTADLVAEGVDDKVDITDMNIYPADFTDFFLCSHVLEHVADDRKAMRELYRILKPGGWGICMVPIVIGLEKTLENPSIVDPKERWKYFGQDDHVRLYERNDYIGRLAEAGFTVEEVTKDNFAGIDFKSYGIKERSVLYVVKKH